jgi:hypothetical protein
MENRLTCAYPMSLSWLSVNLSEYTELIPPGPREKLPLEPHHLMSEGLVEFMIGDRFIMSREFPLLSLKEMLALENLFRLPLE